MTLAAKLAEGIAGLGQDIPVPVQERLLEYVRLMAKWNKVYNLTALRNPGEWVTHHLLDSLAALPFIKGPGVVDVGSGAGLPGLVFAIVRPDWHIVSVETVDKKAAGQRQAVAELEMKNVQVESCRVEELNLANKADTIVSRAFSSLAEFVRLSGHLLKMEEGGARGRWVAMKGRLPVDEIAALPAHIHVRDLIKLSVPGLHAERCVVLMERD